MPNNRIKLIIESGEFKDNRGSVRFFNEFNLENIKRFYEVKNSSANPIRAFHGHLKEEKYVYVIKGKILLCVVKLDKVPNPSKKNKILKFLLSEKNPAIIHIPAGFANGFKSLEKNSRVIYFSTSTLRESIRDDYRLPYDYWGSKIWES